MKRRMAAAFGLALLLGHPAGAVERPEGWVPPRPMNYTSHGIAFMRELLAGRVWVFQAQAPQPEYRSVGAYAFFPDGSLSKCLGRKLRNGIEAWRPSSGARWWVERQPIGAMLAQTDPATKPGPYATPAFYDPKTGRLHTESNSKTTNAVRKPTWIVLADGWVQEGWPAAFLGPCAGLPLPQGMAIEHRQTELDWRAMRTAAPDAIVREFPGSGMTSPGRTGLGRTHGGPTVSSRATLSWLSAHEGAPLGHVSGRVVEIGPEEGGAVRRVRVLSGPATGPEAAPLAPGDWRGTDTPGEGRITRQEDGALLIRIPGFRLELVRPGYPLPFLPLDDRSTAQFAAPAALNRAEEPEAAATRPSDSGPASGSGRCLGDYEGVATWTTGADGERVWDLSGCRPVGAAGQR